MRVMSSMNLPGNVRIQAIQCNVKLLWRCCVDLYIHAIWLPCTCSLYNIQVMNVTGDCKKYALLANLLGIQMTCPGGL